MEYHDLLADENESELLREYVNVAFVRPALPPEEIVQGFEVNDIVDAFHGMSGAPVL